MTLLHLEEKAKNIIQDIKDNGRFQKEDNNIDYKLKLKISQERNNVEVFLINFAKDILSFANADGGIIILGVNENKETGVYKDEGLEDKDIAILDSLDLNDILQKFYSIISVNIHLNLQMFRIGARKFYYLLIEKSNEILVPKKEIKIYGVKEGAIYYRTSGKNECANESTSTFNQFLQIKANEKSKEFMEIWSKLLPQMVDINPREILIINPHQDMVYGFNDKERKLSSGKVEVGDSENKIFNKILNAISNGEIGKMTNENGKPLFKIAVSQSNKFRISSNENAQEIRITRNKNESQGTLLHEEISDGIFREINNLMDANQLLKTESRSFIFGEELYYRIYSERQKLHFNLEYFKMLSEVTSKQLFYCPYLYWVTKMPTEEIATFIVSFLKNYKHPGVYSLIHFFALLSDRGIEFLNNLLDKKYFEISQKPNYYYSFLKLLDAKNRILKSLKLSENTELEFQNYYENAKVGDIMNNKEKYEEVLSRMCSSVFDNKKENKTVCRQLDVLIHGHLISEKSDEIMNEIEKQYNQVKP